MSYIVATRAPLYMCIDGVSVISTLPNFFFF